MSENSELQLQLSMLIYRIERLEECHAARNEIDRLNALGPMEREFTYDYERRMAEAKNILRGMIQVS